MLSLAAPALVLAFQIPVHERVELHSPDAGNYDYLGDAVAIDGTRVLCGAIYDDSRDSTDSGSARLFERGLDGTWSQVARLRAADRAYQEHFGDSVALSGDRALVGASQDDSYLGAAYVFERDAAGAWIQTAKLVASVRGPDQLGHDVALSGERALVGAHEADDAGTGSGAAYVFERNPDGTWSETAKLTASDGGALDNFGIAVALEGGRALVGAWHNDATPGSEGAAYVFERQANGSWLEVAKLVSGETTPFNGSQFGQSVSLSGERALVGDRLLGAAYVFERQASGVWKLAAKLSGSSSDFFGYDVSLSGERAVVGAYWGPSAHLFERRANGAWVEDKVLVHPPEGDWFGFAVACSGDWIAVGGPQDDEEGENSGSVTLFKLPSPEPGVGPGVLGSVVVTLLRSWVPFDPATGSVGVGGPVVPLFLWP